ncbi:TPR-like protein [Pseudovirgaria hyperparasitica]|uniref:TPR-like protein n=1 Tax=Pseudovirgaria hyperparasitica TaxID=470096 RepID=A0A6A6WEV5_9PEZI|nr:TPR-like protein [Pseudovirgaria hyperparasitica]KAF2760689.1 TPR-like protein [Pseudovirgaria hyperparasitica]
MEGSDEDQASTLNEEELRKIELIANDPRADPDYEHTGEATPGNEDEPSDYEITDEDEASDAKRGRGQVRVARGISRSRGRGRGGRGKTRGGHGRGRGRPKVAVEENAIRRRKGPQPGPEPGPEFKAKETKATTAYFKNNYEEALQYAQEAVHADPSLLAGHSLLSEILLAMGREVDSVHVLFNGALTKRDVELWEHIAERYDGLKSMPPGERRRWRELCLSKIIALDTANYEAREEKMKIELETGNITKAFNTCKKLLALRPNEVEVLYQLAELCSYRQILKQNRKLQNAVQCFDKSFEYYFKHDSPISSDLDWSLLNVYLELLHNATMDPRIVLSRLSTVGRWLLGRKEESFWGTQLDDREWDISNERRRQVPEFQADLHSMDAYGAGLPLEIRMRMGTLRLSMGAKHYEEGCKHLRHIEEADGSVSKETLSAYYDTILEVTKVLTQHTLYPLALKYLEALRDYTAVVKPEVYRGLITCYKALNRITDAGSCVRSLRDSGNKDLRSQAIIARHLQDTGREDEAKSLIQELMQRSGAEIILREEGVSIPKLPRSLRYGRRGPYRFRRKNAVPNKIAIEAMPEELVAAMGIEPGQDVEWDVEKYRRLGSFMQRFGPDQHEKLQAAKARDQVIRELVQHLDVLTTMLDNGDINASEEYLAIAKIMIDEFSSCKAFFPIREKRMAFTGYHVSRRGDVDDAALELAELANQLADEEGSTEVRDPLSIPDSFHGIKFQDWLELFCRYSFVAAKDGYLDNCWSALNIANNANVFLRDKQGMQQLYACWLACGLALNNEDLISQASRLYMKMFPYASDAYRLFGIANRAYVGERIQYNSGPWLKYLLRQVRGMDYALLPVDKRRKYNFEAQDHLSFSAGATDGNPHKLAAHDVVLFMCYGHMLIIGGSYYTALNYYFRAYSIRPEDPMISFAIGLCYVQNALKSKVDNRQFQLQQGLAFMYRYYDLRRKSDRAIHKQEAEFNVGRTWHMLGLAHLAVPCYERVLQMSEDVIREQNASMESVADEDFDEENAGYEDFATEAAYSMQVMLAINEDFGAARKLTETWLVIE